MGSVDEHASGSLNVFNCQRWPPDWVYGVGGWFVCRDVSGELDNVRAS